MKEKAQRFKKQPVGQCTPTMCDVTKKVLLVNSFSLDTNGFPRPSWRSWTDLCTKQVLQQLQRYEVKVIDVPAIVGDRKRNPHTKLLRLVHFAGGMGAVMFVYVLLQL
jgi:hypothetical protein